MWAGSIPKIFPNSRTANAPRKFQSEQINYERIKQMTTQNNQETERLAKQTKQAGANWLELECRPKRIVKQAKGSQARLAHPESTDYYAADKRKF